MVIETTVAVEALMTLELLPAHPLRMFIEATRRNVTRFAAVVVRRRRSDVSRAANLHSNREVLRLCRRCCCDEDCACKRCRREDPNCRQLHAYEFHDRASCAAF